MMYKKARKQFDEDRQTKDMDYWNNVLWSDETKINLFGSDGIKCVWRQPGEEYKDKYVLPTVKHPSQHFHVGPMWVFDGLSLGPCMGNPNGTHTFLSISSTWAPCVLAHRGT